MRILQLIFISSCSILSSYCGYPCISVIFEFLATSRSSSTYAALLSYDRQWYILDKTIQSVTHVRGKLFFCRCRYKRRIFHIWGFYVSWSSATCVPVYRILRAQMLPRSCTGAIWNCKNIYKAICQSLQLCAVLSVRLLKANTSLRGSAHNITYTICKWSARNTCE